MLMILWNLRGQMMEDLHLWCCFLYWLCFILHREEKLHSDHLLTLTNSRALSFGLLSLCFVLHELHVPTFSAVGVTVFLQFMQVTTVSNTWTPITVTCFRLCSSSSELSESQSISLICSMVEPVIDINRWRLPIKMRSNSANLIWSV